MKIFKSIKKGVDKLKGSDPHLTINILSGMTYDEILEEQLKLPEDLQYVAELEFYLILKFPEKQHEKIRMIKASSPLIRKSLNKFKLNNDGLYKNMFKASYDNIIKNGGFKYLNIELTDEQKMIIE